MISQIIIIILLILILLLVLVVVVVVAVAIAVVVVIVIIIVIVIVIIYWCEFHSRFGEHIESHREQCLGSLTDIGIVQNFPGLPELK